MRTRLFGLCHAILFLFLVWAALLSCSSGVLTPIYESPTNNVYLEWVPDESFRASHPATIAPTTLRRTLRGLLVQTQKGLLDRYSGQERQPKRVLSDDDVELLLPHLVSALSQATPEEQVVFQRLYAYDLGSNSTAGSLYLQEDLIFVTLTHYARSPGRPDIRYVQNRQVSDTTGLADSTVLFVPPEALETDRSQQKAAKPTLAINYPLLETLPDTFEKAASDSHPRLTETTPPPDRLDGSPEPPPEDRQLRAIEEKVNKQEQELEQLKRELRELQREGTE